MAVREQQQRQPRQRHGRCPAGLQKHRQPAERQRPLAGAVVEHRVHAAGAAECEEQADTQQRPPDRVAGLMPGHHHPHHGEGQVQEDDGVVPGQYPLMSHCLKHPGQGHQRQQQAAENQRGRR